MSTPSIQILIAQAQQVLNLKSSNEIRATLAAVIANVNVGTPLNPNITTQQLWDQFYEIVRQPTDDIESIIADQMMRFMFSYGTSPQISTGIVDPEGIVTAVPGSIYFNIAIAASPVQFVKGSGSGNTGWV
jgi:hypothetical protein